LRSKKDKKEVGFGRISEQHPAVLVALASIGGNVSADMLAYVLLMREKHLGTVPMEKAMLKYCPRFQ